MKRLTRITLLILLLLVFLLPASVSAKSDDYKPIPGDKVIFGETFTLGKNETLDGSIVVIGGVIRLEEGSLVKGDVVGIGSSATIAGEVNQSVVAIGGVLNLEDTALVRGDLIAPGSVMKKAESAKIFGQVITSNGPIKIEGLPTPEVPAVPDNNNFPEEPEFPAPDMRTSLSERTTSFFAPVIQGLWFMFRLFAVSAVAVVLVLLVPAQSQRTSDVVMSEPVLSGGLGLLTLIIAGPVMVILSITIILIPVTLLLALLLLFGLFFGWIAIGEEIGRRIEVALGQDWSGAIQAGIGTFILTFLISGLNLVFWDIVGWMLGFLVASIGLGAVLLSRFGTYKYSSRRAVSAAPGGEMTIPPVIAETKAAPAPEKSTEDKPAPPIKTSAPKTGTKATTSKKTAVKKTGTKTTASKKTAAKKTGTKKTSAKKSEASSKGSEKPKGND